MPTTTVERARPVRTGLSRTSDRWPHPETWAASRARIQQEEKLLMAQYFASHDFLVQKKQNPVADARENTASFLANQGTGPNVVVEESLKWIEGHAKEGPFHMTWYSNGALVPATLFEFRQRNPDLTAATHVHLFPGTVDIQLQAQIGTEAQEYASRITRQFSYMILSGHSFDLQTGHVKFHFDREIPIQRTCALLKATEKFLFFDSKKFTGEGGVGYSLRDLLSTCNGVVIYTVSSDRSAEIKTAFNSLSAELLTETPDQADGREWKTLRLTLVGRDNVPTDSIPYEGFLRVSRRSERA
jgi:hypothetical protein